MPFSSILFLFRIITNMNIKKYGGKERKFDYKLLNIYSCASKKASRSASLHRKLNCSVTVEAVVCIPLFLYASICLIWLLELRAVQLTVRCALQEAGKALTVELSEVPVLVPADLEGKIENIIGCERIARSVIVNGIRCDESYVRMNTGIMELKATYTARVPFPQFVIAPLEYEESMRMKIWNGYRKSSLPDFELETIVYVTETGIVYHKDSKCTYLEPSVRGVSASEIDSLRNENGGRYYACGACAGLSGNQVYVTDYGTRYHKSASCKRIDRIVYTVPLKEVKGKGACSKCGG